VSGKFVIGLIVALHGSEAPRVERKKAEECRELRDQWSASYHEKNAELAEAQPVANRVEARRKQSADPKAIDLYGGLSGIRMNVPEFELAEGAILKATYAHVMAPYMVAFNRPVGDAAHPAPWRAASGGLGFDIEVQLSLRADSRPTPLDRVGTVRWLLALLRLHHPAGIRMPILSDIDFSQAASSESEPIFWPLELSPRHLVIENPQDYEFILEETLVWLRTHFGHSEDLLNDSRFGLAFRALDACHSADTLSSAMLLIWSALEALYRPGQPGITKEAERLHCDAPVQ